MTRSTAAATRVVHLEMFYSTMSFDIPSGHSRACHCRVCHSVQLTHNQRRALSKSFFPEQLRKLAEAGERMSCARRGISACVTSPQDNPRANHSRCLACCLVGHSRLLCIQARYSHRSLSISASSLHFSQLKAMVKPIKQDGCDWRKFSLSQLTVSTCGCMVTLRD